MLLQTIQLRKYFYASSLPFLNRNKGRAIRAVDGVDLQIEKSEIIGLVGESGCGKTTLGRLLLKLAAPTSGQILFEGSDITKFSRTNTKKFRKQVQFIYQDPFDSLDPRRTVFDSVKEPIEANHLSKNKSDTKETVVSLLNAVRLTPPELFMRRFPHELSGGQRQRVAIARALGVNPEIIIADEITSMLDVSVRGDLLNLLLSMREKFSVSVLLITHDIPSAAQICDKIAVMYMGRIVEEGPSEEILQKPLHPYTKALVSAVPKIGKKLETLPLVAKEIPNPLELPNGCKFHPRCPEKFGPCDLDEPHLLEMDSRRKCACYLYGN